MKANYVTEMKRSSQGNVQTFYRHNDGVGIQCGLSSRSLIIFARNTNDMIMTYTRCSCSECVCVCGGAFYNLSHCFLPGEVALGEKMYVDSSTVCSQRDWWVLGYNMSEAKSQWTIINAYSFTIIGKRRGQGNGKRWRKGAKQKWRPEDRICSTCI